MYEIRDKSGSLSFSLFSLSHSPTQTPLSHPTAHSAGSLPLSAFVWQSLYLCLALSCLPLSLSLLYLLRHVPCSDHLVSSARDDVRGEIPDATENLRTTVI